MSLPRPVAAWRSPGLAWSSPNARPCLARSSHGLISSNLPPTFRFFHVKMLGSPRPQTGARILISRKRGFRGPKTPISNRPYKGWEKGVFGSKIPISMCSLVEKNPLSRKWGSGVGGIPCQNGAEKEKFAGRSFPPPGQKVRMDTLLKTSYFGLFHCSFSEKQGGPGTEPEPETRTVGTVSPGTAGTAGTVFQEEQILNYLPPPPESRIERWVPKSTVDT